MYGEFLKEEYLSFLVLVDHLIASYLEMMATIEVIFHRSGNAETRAIDINLDGFLFTGKLWILLVVQCNRSS